MLFNVLLVFLPVAGILYLDVYEARLLESQERAMAQQARLLAAAVDDVDTLDPDRARAILQRLDVGDTRLQVYDATGALIADSARLARRPATRVPESISASSVAPQADVRDAWLYRVGARLAAVRTYVRDWLPLASQTLPSSYGSATAPGDAAPVEVRRALNGQYGAVTRPTPGQRSLTLSIALPVGRGGGDRRGAVVVSQSTFRILQALYDVRLQVFRVVVASLSVAVVISTLVALTIVRPIRRLRRMALSLAEGRPAPAGFPGTTRRDEVGDLARALDELTQRLHTQVALLEAFTADVAHEFRNPLAAVRSAADVLDDAASDAERRHFTACIRRDVQRLDQLVVGAREIARVGSALHSGEPGTSDLATVTREVVGTGYRGHEVQLSLDDAEWHVRGHPDRLRQVLDNLVSNATSFSPAPGSVNVVLRREAGAAVVQVCDRGPGIPDEHLERIFDRFFSYRPACATARQQHVGLGLAIARAIVEDTGGSITAGNRTSGGALLEVRLPLAPR